MKNLHSTARERRRLEFRLKHEKPCSGRGWRSSRSAIRRSCGQHARPPGCLSRATGSGNSEGSIEYERASEDVQHRDTPAQLPVSGVNDAIGWNGSQKIGLSAREAGLLLGMSDPQIRRRLAHGTLIYSVTRRKIDPESVRRLFPDDGTMRLRQLVLEWILAGELVAPAPASCYAPPVSLSDLVKATAI